MDAHYFDIGYTVVYRAESNVIAFRADPAKKKQSDAWVAVAHKALDLCR